MIQIYETFKTEAEAQARKEWYLRAYPPGGYETTLSVHQYNGKWHVSGYRASHCD